MQNEPTHARTMEMVAGMGVKYQQRAILALALTNAVAARERVNAVEALIRGDAPAD